MTDPADRVRIDKWLWAARFFKTRSLAADAVEGAKVLVNGERVKPAKALKAGDALVVRNGQVVWEVAVVALSERRGSAAEAVKLYSESESSRLARVETSEQLKAERRSNPFPAGRPTKRQRRQIIRFTRNDD
ncbi:MAG: S4 domain-containing protein [Betaproteobacteria bacterium]